jgi:hypothetical protein
MPARIGMHADAPLGRTERSARLVRPKVPTDIAAGARAHLTRLARNSGDRRLYTTAARVTMGCGGGRGRRHGGGRAGGQARAAVAGTPERPRDSDRLDGDRCEVRMGPTDPVLGGSHQCTRDPASRRVEITGNPPHLIVQLHSSSRPMSHPGLATSAPRSSARWHNARSADTSVTRPSASAVSAMRVSSPLPGACRMVTPSATPASTPLRAAPSRTTTTGSASRPTPTAARTRSTNSRAARGRSRHQPFGRDPTTFAASISSTRSLSPFRS